MTKKTAVAAATKKAANNVVKSKLAVKQSKETVKKTKQVIYLHEGISGKQLVNSKISTNNAAKKESKSFSHCLKLALKNDDNFFVSFKGFKESDMTPKNLLPFLKDTEAKNGNFSMWLIMTLVKRFYEDQK
ncbi:MAG: hypothetical protein ACOVNR_04125 [Chitinophagaceae bacterium]|jgi:hypothetical protein